MGNKIISFQVDGLWNRWNIRWNNINPQMNILVGINGSGKTTLLNMLYGYYSTGSNSLVQSMEVIPVKLNEGEKIIYLKSLDNYTQKDKRKKSNALLQELEYIVYQNKENFSFFNYRMSILDYPDRATEINKRINGFLMLVNDFFTETGKKLVIRDGRLVFVQGESTIELETLSSGEKQLLLILMNVFLLEEKPAVVFMDEPEIALHVSWQYKLLDTLTKLNPQAQFIITTHSPSIFGNGWGGNVVYMEDILEKS
ncbi:MAG: ATP-binding protein [Bacteroidales bacterium]|nr:ATP-binding protein [Bacteroidales bacterium]